VQLPWPRCREVATHKKNMTSSLYMFRVSTAPIIRSTQKCKYNLRYWSNFLCSYLPATWPSCPTWPRCREVAASGVHTTVNTVSGTGRIFCAATCNVTNLPNLATLQGGSCTKRMTSTGDCIYSFLYSWWWVRLTRETCRVNSQNNK